MKLRPEMGIDRRDDELDEGKRKEPRSFPALLQSNILKSAPTAQRKETGDAAEPGEGEG